METFSALLALFAGNSAVTVEFPAQMPVTRSFDGWSAPEHNSWVNNREAGDWRRHHAHYDVILMKNYVPTVNVNACGAAIFLEVSWTIRLWLTIMDNQINLDVITFNFSFSTEPTNHPAPWDARLSAGTVMIKFGPMKNGLECLREANFHELNTPKRGPIHQHTLSLIPVWISNYTHYIVWD